MENNSRSRRSRPSHRNWLSRAARRRSCRSGSNKSSGGAMPKYRIAWMPGDGVGVDVMNATRIALDALRLDADYIPADIGWEFWRTEGNPLPERTVKILRETNCAMFGAITSKPKEEANAELDPSLKGKGLSYTS